MTPLEKQLTTVVVMVQEELNETALRIQRTLEANLWHQRTHVADVVLCLQQYGINPGTLDDGELREKVRVVVQSTEAHHPDDLDD